MDTFLESDYYAKGLYFTVLEHIHGLRFLGATGLVLQGIFYKKKKHVQLSKIGAQQDIAIDCDLGSSTISGKDKNKSCVGL